MFFIAFNSVGGLLLTLGLIVNAIGFLLYRKVSIRSSPARYLLGAQYLFDAAACLVILMYLVSYNLEIERNRFVYTVFCSLWLSHYAFWFVNSLSSTNLVLLAFDRYWAVVQATSYPKNVTRYVFVLISITWIFTISSTAPLLCNNMCFPFILNGTVMPFRISPIVISTGFTLGYLVPSITLCWLQFCTLRVIRRLKRNVTLKRVDENRISFESNLLAISVATVIMTVTYFFSRVYTHAIILSHSFGIDLGMIQGDWERPYFIAYGINYLIEPLVLSLSLPGMRLIIVRMFKSFIFNLPLSLRTGRM